MDALRSGVAKPVREPDHDPSSNWTLRFGQTRIASQVAWEKPFLQCLKETETEQHVHGI